MIRFSVIIPNYNHALFLEKRIESVLAQRFPPAEIILLDDASTDDSRTILEGYRNHPLVTHLVYNNTNSGSPFHQWAKGIGLAKEEWIWVAETDDEADPGFLETAAFSLQQYGTTAGLFYCDAAIVEEEEKKPTLFSTQKNNWFHTGKWSEPYYEEGTTELADGLALRCTINNVSSAVMRNSLLQQCIPYWKNFRFHGDWFTYAYIATRAAIVYAPDCLNHYRHYSGNIQSQLPADGRNREECFRILSFIYPYYPLPRRKEWLREFVRLNLATGLVSGRHTWLHYFRIDCRLAFKVLRILLKDRWSPAKPTAS